MRTPIVILALAFGALLASCDRAPKVYDVSVTPSSPEMGTVSPAADTTLEEGKTLRLEATPAEGYRFVRWAGDLDESTNPYELKVDQNYDIVGEFEIKTYDLDLIIEGEGTVSQQVMAADSYVHGTRVQLIAEPAEGYHFLEWRGAVQSASDTVEVTVDEPKQVTAVFEINSYELEVLIEGNGSVDQRVIAADAKNYDHGTVVELTAVPDEGHHFVEWQGDLQSTENPAQVTVDGPKQVTAVFEINSYELKLNADGPGNIFPSPDRESYDHGTEVELEAKPNVGYDFVEWTGDHEGTDNPATVVMDREREISGHFEISTYTLNVDVKGEGGVEIDPDQATYEHGTEVTLKATADDHFVFRKWEGSLGSTSRTLTLTMDQDLNLRAVFLRKFVIMPLGDSHTHNPGSREELWDLLTGDGYLVDFVGDQDRPKKGISIPDTDHEGVPGITIDEVSDKIVDVLSRHSPRYVNLMVGTNDIVWGYDETAQQIANRWDDLVQKILDNTPSHSYVVAATIPPATSEIVGDESLDVRDRAEQIKLFNEAIRQHVSQRKNNGDRIVLADMYAQMNVPDHVSDDGVHLTEEGYKLMGTIYYQALVDLLGL